MFDYRAVYEIQLQVSVDFLRVVQLCFMNAYPHQMKHIKVFISTIYVFLSDETCTVFLFVLAFQFIYLFTITLFCAPECVGKYQFE